MGKWKSERKGKETEPTHTYYTHHTTTVGVCVGWWKGKEKQRGIGKRETERKERVGAQAGDGGPTGC